ncbi:putative replication-associated protein [Blattamonas nauphoetae]|uniref:Replication-associated protein n=1 Tax=Blattamonas nauphoetae TaxID=2049346 RepID=A0ABQ9WP73_9EUKA|nr:putative replication-associated protein [Blattamonas nauphoetae]
MAEEFLFDDEAVQNEPDQAEEVVNTRARGRAFCFQKPFYSEQDEQQLQGIQCRYLVYKRDVMPLTDDRVIQGYVVFQNARTVRAVQRDLPYGFIAWPATGTAAHNTELCTRPGHTFAKGALPTQGRRTDLEQIGEQLRTRTPAQIIQEQPHVGILHFRGLHAVYRVLHPVNPFEFKTRHVPWLCGPTGSGKTRYAYEFAQRRGLRTSQLPLPIQWFDGITQETECVIIDDLRNEDVADRFSLLLQLLDGRPVKVSVKNAFSDWLPDYVFITAECAPAGTFPSRPQHQIDQLVRRIRGPYLFGAPGGPQPGPPDDLRRDFPVDEPRNAVTPDGSQPNHGQSQD